MKNILPKPATIVAASLSIFLLLSSCSQKIGFQTSAVEPAARGTVKVDRDKNNNYEINLDVRNLAEPNRLQTPKQAYVVWMDTQQNGTQNLGQLKTGTGMLSSALKAELKAITPYKPIRIFITAEDGSTVQVPSSFVVLNTNSF